VAAYTSGDPIIAGSCPSRTPSHHGRRGQSRSSPLAPPHELISPLTCAYVVRELKGLAVVERCSFARPLRRFTTGSPSSAYRLLSDQLSDSGSTTRTFSQTFTD
jgi:hypothetical protein